MNRSYRAFFLILGLALSGAARAEEIPWGRIDRGLAQLANGDGNAAAASFQKARRADESGLAELLMDLTMAYVAGDFETGYRDRDLLDIAHRHFSVRHVPHAAVEKTLSRVRDLVKHPVEGTSSHYLRPLLCNLRLLSGDRATDGEAVLEASGTSSDMGPFIRPRPEFTPSPRLTDSAKREHAAETVVIDAELVLDSEGCPASRKLLSPLPDPLVDQALASLGWWAYEPARYDGVAVSWKLPLNLRIQLVPEP
jgi:hypothetical protein